MHRRRSNSPHYGAAGRVSFMTRRFEDSIDDLTNRSIRESLLEIDTAMEKRFGSNTGKQKIVPEKPKAD